MQVAPGWRGQIRLNGEDRRRAIAQYAKPPKAGGLQRQPKPVDAIGRHDQRSAGGRSVERRTKGDTALKDSCAVETGLAACRKAA